MHGDTIFGLFTKNFFPSRTFCPNSSISTLTLLAFLLREKSERARAMINVYLLPSFLLSLDSHTNEAK